MRGATPGQWSCIVQESKLSTGQRSQPVSSISLSSASFLPLGSFTKSCLGFPCCWTESYKPNKMPPTHHPQHKNTFLSKWLFFNFFLLYFVCTRYIFCMCVTAPMSCSDHGGQRTAAESQHSESRGRCISVFSRSARCTQ